MSAFRSIGFRLTLGIVLLFGVILFCVRTFALVGFSIMPASSMAPAIPSGSQVTFEKFSFWFRDPRRGECVMFRTDNISEMPKGQLWVKRVVGLPGEQLLFSNRVLYINGAPVTLTNSAGPILFDLPRGHVGPVITNLTIAASRYFLVGDNTTNSMDSRFFGPISRADIFARVDEP